MLEYHHDFPYGKGGSHPESNVRLVCRSHNQWEAAREYGEAVWTRRSSNKGSDVSDKDCFVPGDSYTDTKAKPGGEDTR